MYIPLENLTATPTQKEAIIHPQTPLMILAGAGTGKTFLAVAKAVSYLQKGKVKKIILLVFVQYMRHYNIIIT